MCISLQTSLYGHVDWNFSVQSAMSSDDVEGVAGLAFTVDRLAWIFSLNLSNFVKKSISDACWPIELAGLSSVVLSRFYCIEII